MDVFYTYMWLREDGRPYYVGKGKGNRGFTGNNHRVKCPTNPDLIITQTWPSEKDAFEAEKFLISYYGKLSDKSGCLANLTDGGEGCCGYQPALGKTWSLTEETKLKMSLSARK